MVMVELIEDEELICSFVMLFDNVCVVIVGCKVCVMVCDLVLFFEFVWDMVFEVYIVEVEGWVVDIDVLVCVFG